MKTLSIFVSSTFRDMDFERDCLNNLVLPRLQEHYLRYGYVVRLFDLRWGVIANDKEEDRESRILRTCFDAIDSCRPFFIAFLGHRYGWIPSAAPDGQADALIKKTGTGTPSVTALEIAYGIFHKGNYARSLVFIRDKASYNNVTEPEVYLEQETGARHKVELLKDDIRKRFTENGCGTHVIPYYVNLNEPSCATPGMVSFLEQSIRGCIDEFIEVDSASPVDTYDILAERALMHYVCPQNCLPVVSDILEGKNALVYGDEGYGKTSLSFAVSQELKQRGRIVLYHTVGCSDLSYDPHEMIWEWNQRLVEFTRFRGTSYQRMGSIEDEWSRLYHLAGLQPGKVTIVIDSIDLLHGGFCRDNMMFALPSDIQFVIFSKERLPNWEKGLKAVPFRLEGLTESEAVDLVDQICGFKGKRLGQQVVDTILRTRVSEDGLYSPLDLLTLLGFLVSMNAGDFKEIRNGEGESEEDKIERYMISLINGTPRELKGMYDVLIQQIGAVFGDRALVPFKVLALSRSGLDEEELHSILGPGFDLLQFTLVRQYLHQTLTDDFASRRWQFRQNTVRKALTDYGTPFLPCNDDLLNRMSETPFLNEERVYYAVLAMNTAALSEYVSYYDEGVITKELVMAKWSTSLDHVSECLIGCLNGDEKLVDKVFRLLIFRLYLQTLDEKLDVRIAYWSSILAVLKREQPLERERQLFLRARCNEILGESYHSAGDTEQALNRFQDAGCLFHILGMDTEEEKCKIELISIIKHQS